MPRHNSNAIELMRAITREAEAIGGLFARAGLDATGVYWRRDPHANPQRADLKMSDGTWLTVTVEQNEEKPR